MDGAHAAGTIGAVTHNGQGVASVNWQVKLLSMRVLGKCIGKTLDICAGLSVTGIPANLHLAKVLNLVALARAPQPISRPSTM